MASISATEEDAVRAVDNSAAGLLESGLSGRQIREGCFSFPVADQVRWTMNSPARSTQWPTTAAPSDGSEKISGDSHPRPVDLEWLLEGWWIEAVATRIHGHLASCSHCRTELKARRAVLWGSLLRSA